jgi:hypothetical protein
MKFRAKTKTNLLMNLKCYLLNKTKRTNSSSKKHTNKKALLL